MTPAPAGAQPQRNRAGDDTRRRLIATAERLIAENGLQAVSVRDITGAADANSAAIHYHFGSKDGLVRAVLADRAEALQARRRAHLAALGEVPTVAELARALVLPTIELTGAEAGDGDATYVGFLAALLEDRSMIDAIDEHFGPQYDQYVVALRAARPELPEAVAVNRVAFATHLVLNAASPQPRGIRLWLDVHRPGTSERLRDDLIDFLAGALAADVDPTRS